MGTGFKIDINMNRRIRTDFLTATPSFLTGMGSVLNIGGNYPEFNASDSPEEADRLALEADWRMVGQDFEDVFEEFRGKFDR